MSFTHKGFAKRLRGLIREKSLKDISTITGLSRETIRILSCRETSPRIATVEKLATALKVSPSWLAFGHDCKEADNG